MLECTLQECALREGTLQEDINSKRVPPPGGGRRPGLWAMGHRLWVCGPASSRRVTSAAPSNKRAGGAARMPSALLQRPSQPWAQQDSKSSPSLAKICHWRKHTVTCQKCQGRPWSLYLAIKCPKSYWLLVAGSPILGSRYAVENILGACSATHQALRALKWARYYDTIGTCHSEQRDCAEPHTACPTP